MHVLGRAHMRVEGGDDVRQGVARDHVPLGGEIGHDAAQSLLREAKRLIPAVRDEQRTRGDDPRLPPFGQRLEIGIDDGMLNVGQRSRAARPSAGVACARA